jgi:hypothetical protein
VFDATPLLRLYAGARRRRLAAVAPAAAQRHQLARLVAAARHTAFGRAHDFAGVRDVAGYQARVPLARYEDFWRDWWQGAFPRLDDLTWPGRIPYFAATSGTTSGASKHIPVSRAMNRANARAAADLLVHHVAARPASRVLAGRTFMLGGSTALGREADGIFSGDLSGIASATAPAWFRPWSFPPPEIGRIADWERKVDRLADAVLDADIRLVGGTPSWLLLLFDALEALRPSNGRGLAAWFPDLEMLVHGGVDFAPYRARFEQLLAATHAELREVYPASEGFIAVDDHGGSRRADDGLRLLLDNGLFLEFVPLDELDSGNPTRHWIGTAETGVVYAIAVASCAGLWSYLVGDTVEFITLDPPRVRMTGRTSYMLSAFGEHLIGAELEAAVAAAARAAGTDVTDWSVGAVFPQQLGELGRHRFVVEFAGGAADAALRERFVQVLDEALSAANEDYAAHRSGGFGMAAPELVVAPPGTFARWMKSRQRLGGQHKVPRVIGDGGLFAGLQEFAAGARSESAAS